MIISILTLIANWITSLATTVTAYKERKRVSNRTNNYTKKLYTFLKSYKSIYESQLQIMKDIFRVENYNEYISNVSRINDLEMISYIESVMRTCQSSIEEFPCKTEEMIDKDEYDILVKFTAYLKNFFLITNEIKDAARKDKESESKITIQMYKQNLMQGIPYSLKTECGGVDLEFPIFIEKFDDKIDSMWNNIEDNFIKASEKSNGRYFSISR